MIVDFFENSNRYFGLGKRFKQAFEFIESNNFDELQCGRYEFDGDNIYANVEEYFTKTHSKPEYHKKYADIQFLVKGIEMIGYCPIEELNIHDDFDDKKDIGFGLGAVDFVKINKGQFMILFPEDAHQPCMAVAEPCEVKKVVVKVKLDD